MNDFPEDRDFVESEYIEDILGKVPVYANCEMVVGEITSKTTGQVGAFITPILADGMVTATFVLSKQMVELIIARLQEALPLITLEGAQLTSNEVSVNRFSKEDLN